MPRGRATGALDDGLVEDEEDQLAELLELHEDIDVVAELHAAVSSKVVIHDQRGNLTKSLFGGFTIDDNPMLRGTAD